MLLEKTYCREGEVEFRSGCGRIQFHRAEEERWLVEKFGFNSGCNHIPPRAPAEWPALRLRDLWLRVASFFFPRTPMCACQRWRDCALLRGKSKWPLRPHDTRCIGDSELGALAINAFKERDVRSDACRPTYSVPVRLWRFLVDEATSRDQDFVRP